MKKIPTPNPRIFFVVKANGQVVPFDREKIRTSLQRVGASKFLIDSILKAISQKLFNGISTKQLYAIVFSELRKQHKPVAGKYHLKRAIMELGP